MKGGEQLTSGSPHRILVVDDDPAQRSLFESFLASRGFEVITASSGDEAFALLQSRPVDMMISDVRMPGMSGLEVLRRLGEGAARLPVVMVTAYPDIRDAVGAIRDGAVNYLVKPIDLDELLSLVEESIGVSRRRESPEPLDLELPDDVVAQSPAFRNVLREVALVAPSDSRILVTGESGVGKEVIADLVHAWSPRCDGPLIKVNCASLPESLLESELFGHEKGSFTGATGTRVGRFEEARNGTILLDEIGEMSPGLQAKLLRVTQDGTFQRVGSNEERRTNARIIASSNRCLETEVREVRFREDLFFRLNVVEIFVPPLRERKADIIPLATLFIRRFSQGRPRFSASVISCLQVYSWPGNVRELRNAMERAALMARGDVILPEHLTERIQEAALVVDGASQVGSSETPMEEVERGMILQTLRQNDFNRTRTARALGISRRALIYKLQRYRGQGFAVDPE